jgi:putative FmdB family regulatory protein
MPGTAAAGYRRWVPLYDFRCRECAQTFEVSRPMSQSGDAATCPAGHADTVKLLPTVAVAVGGRRAAPAPAGRGGGGCCGGACGCG